MPTFIERAGTTWLWLVLIALFVAMLVAWAIDPLGSADEVEPAPRTVAESTEWTVRPDSPAIAVDLPDVPVKAVPIDSDMANQATS